MSTSNARPQHHESYTLSTDPTYHQMCSLQLHNFRDVSDYGQQLIDLYDMLRSSYPQSSFPPSFLITCFVTGLGGDYGEWRRNIVHTARVEVAGTWPDELLDFQYIFEAALEEESKLAAGRPHAEKSEQQSCFTANGRGGPLKKEMINNGYYDNNESYGAYETYDDHANIPSDNENKDEGDEEQDEDEAHDDSNHMAVHHHNDTRDGEHRTLQQESQHLTFAMQQQIHQQIASTLNDKPVAPQKWPPGDPWLDGVMCHAHTNNRGRNVHHSSEWCPLRGFPQMWSTLPPAVRQAREQYWARIQPELTSKWVDRAIDDAIYHVEKNEYTKALEVWKAFQLLGFDIDVSAYTRRQIYLLSEDHDRAQDKDKKGITRDTHAMKAEEDENSYGGQGRYQLPPQPWPLDTPWKHAGYTVCSHPAHNGIPENLIMHSVEYCPRLGVPKYWDDLDSIERTAQESLWSSMKQHMPIEYLHLAVDEAIHRMEQKKYSQEREVIRKQDRKRKPKRRGKKDENNIVENVIQEPSYDKVSKPAYYNQ